MASRPVPVNLVNTGTAPVTFSSAKVTGSRDFSVVSNDCGVIAVGDMCRVYVGFTAACRAT